jgi:hypothetical protein
MIWFFYDIRDERNLSVIQYSIEEFDPAAKVHLQNTFTEDEFVKNYENVKLDILVANYNQKFFQRIRNAPFSSLIICKDRMESESCIDVFEKSTSNARQIILINNITTNEVLLNFKHTLN